MTRLSVKEAIARIREGSQVILVDDEDRENEGDLCFAAEKVTAAQINFMVRYGRGLVCLTLTPERIRTLGLAKMTQTNASRFGTDFCVSIEARHGVTTGISAADRATTIRAAMAADAGPESVVSPGHVFPICARDGGVLVRCGQTEGSVDLARLAGLEPAGVICEIIKDDGTMARRPDLESFARTHGLGIVTIADLIQYRLRQEALIREVARAEVTPWGLGQLFSLRVFRSDVSRVQFMVLVLGDVQRADPVLVRVHRATLPTDVLGVENPLDQAEPSKNRAALARMVQAGAGIFVYVIPEEIDVGAQVMALSAAERGADAVPAAAGAPELREFGLGAQVLHHLGAKRIQLLTDHPRRIVGLTGFDLEVTGTVPLHG